MGENNGLSRIVQQQIECTIKCAEANIELRGAVERLSEDIYRVEERLQRLEDILGTRMGDHDASIANLKDAIKTLDIGVTRLQESVKLLCDLTRTLETSIEEARKKINGFEGTVKRASNWMETLRDWALVLGVLASVVGIIVKLVFGG